MKWNDEGWQGDLTGFSVSMQVAIKPKYQVIRLNLLDGFDTFPENLINSHSTGN